MRESIRVVKHFPHPPARVWRAISEREQLAKWLMPNDFSVAEPGARFSFDAGQWGTVQCEITQVDPGRLLRFTWRNPPLDTTLTFELTPEPGGTQLVLVHDGFDPADPRQKFALQAMGEGWAKNDRLPALLDTLA